RRCAGGRRAAAPAEPVVGAELRGPLRAGRPVTAARGLGAGIDLADREAGGHVDGGGGRRLGGELDGRAVRVYVVLHELNSFWLHVTRCNGSLPPRSSASRGGAVS